MLDFDAPAVLTAVLAVLAGIAFLILGGWTHTVVLILVGSAMIVFAVAYFIACVRVLQEHEREQHKHDH